MFQGTVRNKGGRLIDETFQETREECAKVLFPRNPRADTVSTCGAYQDFRSHWKGNGTNIQWIKRSAWEKGETA